MGGQGKSLMKNLRESDGKVQRSSAAGIFKACVLGNIWKFPEVFLAVISGIRDTTRIEQLRTKNAGQHPFAQDGFHHTE